MDPQDMEQFEQLGMEDAAEPAPAAPKLVSRTCARALQR